jgi:hypothetical protein
MYTLDNDAMQGFGWDSHKVRPWYKVVEQKIPDFQVIWTCDCNAAMNFPSVHRLLQHCRVGLEQATSVAWAT